MGLLFALGAASIAWSWAPDSSWLGSAQMLAYLAVFAGVIMLARPWARGWPCVLGALILWSAALCAWSLLAKVFPATLAAGNQYGRLQAPFGYWNAIALAAAMGTPCCLWLGARRDGGRRLAALAAPALTLLVSVLVLSYSRSADLAAAVAVGLWLIAVPLRLRAIALLTLGAAGGAVISAWFFTHHGLDGNGVAMSVQDPAGHTFGFVVLGVLALISILSFALSRAQDRHTIQPATRRRIGGGIIVLLGLGVVGALVKLATSARGFGGEISYHWHELTNPAAVVSAGSASRVFQFGSSRPLYWHEALHVGHLAYWKGVGVLGFSVARLLDPVSTDYVFQAHSYVFETYADLGTLGLVVSAALLAAWLVSSGRALSPRRSWSALDGEAHSERIALVTLVVVVVGFGVQGTIDWTWYIPGVAVPALLAAGWVAGRGPGAPLTRRLRSPLDRPVALGVCAALLVSVLIGGWLIWRPLHSVQLVNSPDSLAQAQAAQRADPFSLLPYETLSAFELDQRRPAAAVATLQQATRMQPHNPQSWVLLAQLEEQRHDWAAMLMAANAAQARIETPNALEATAISLTTVADQQLSAQAVRQARPRPTGLSAPRSPATSASPPAAHRRR